MTADPWAGASSVVPEPRWLTREDRVELGAKTVALLDAGQDWAPDDYKPIAPDLGDASHRDIMRDLVTDVLDVVYPQVTTAGEIEVLPVDTVMINDRRRVVVRSIAADNRAVDHGKHWNEPNAPATNGRGKPRGWSSAELAQDGPWTIVAKRADA